MAVLARTLSQSVAGFGRTLEALAVHNGWSALVILLLGDPHLLKGRQRGQDGATNPDGVLALGWCDDLDPHGRRRKSCNFLLHTIRNSRVHGGTSRLASG